MASSYLCEETTVQTRDCCIDSFDAGNDQHRATHTECLVPSTDDFLLVIFEGVHFFRFVNNMFNFANDLHFVVIVNGGLPINEFLFLSILLVSKATLIAVLFAVRNFVVDDSNAQSKADGSQSAKYRKRFTGNISSRNIFPIRSYRTISSFLKRSSRLNSLRTDRKASSIFC
mmetsp:Transcript_6012/g.14908  ORF Transcript_6012/g.14908 Transcript_6012/m.14908 type:complete len:172 (-) Transcript_6012:577-1092(-)